MPENNKLSFLDGIRYPFQVVNKNLISFITIIGIYSFIVTVVSTVLGRNISCNMNYEETGIFCSFSFYNWAISQAFFLLMVGTFAKKWFDVYHENASWKDAFILKDYKMCLKSTAFILFYIAIWTGMALSFYVLKARVVTPDWKLELFIFFVFSLFIILGLLLLLNSMLFSRFLEGKKWLCLNKTLSPIFDNIYKFFCWFLFYMIFFMLLLQLFISLGYAEFISNKWVRSIVLDFTVNCGILVMLGFSLPLLEYQAKSIFED